MATFVPVPDTGEFHLMFTYQGQVCQNVLHTHQHEAYTAPGLADVTAIMISWWIDTMAGLVSDQLQLDRIEAFSLESIDAVSFVDIAGLPHVGTLDEQVMPGNVTVAVKLGTGQRGRSYRGRIYHLGLTIGAVENSKLTPTAIIALTGAYAALVDTLGTAGHDLAVVSKFSGGAPRTTGIATAVNSVSIDPSVDSQRRRLPGRGR